MSHIENSALASGLLSLRTACAQKCFKPLNRKMPLMYTHFELRDPVLGTVKLDELTSNLIGSPAVQRLSFIRKLDLANLFYPTATHTYFGHALGTMIAATSIAERLKLSSEDIDCLKAASILSHSYVCPFQKILEMIRQGITGFRPHSLIESAIVRPDVSKILSKHGIDSDRIYSVILGKDKNEILNQILTGPLAASYLDSVIRDAYYLGLSGDTQLAHRIIENTQVIELGNHQWIAVTDGAIPDIQRLTITRDQLFSKAYHNRRVLSARLMMRKMLEYLFAEGTLDISHLLTMSDEDLLIVLRENVQGKFKLLFKDLFARNYYDLIFSGKITSDILAESTEDLESEFEGRIADESGMDSLYIAIKISPFRVFEERNIPIVRREHVSDFGSVSQIVMEQEREELKSQRILCFASSRARGKVGMLRKAARGFFGAEKQ